MHLVYTGQEPPKFWQHAIFLAGPTPRDAKTPSWRPEALRILEHLEYKGVVFVPEYADGEARPSYDEQVEWERLCLNLADRIVFWVPRDLVSMPAFTTNVEFGRYCTTGKAVLGFPKGSPKNQYLEWLGGVEGVPVFHDLEATLAVAVAGSDGPLRAGGERYVPVDVFRTPMFQAWYGNLKAVGNRLDEAKVLWTFRIPKKGVFSYVLWVKVWIDAEGRWKENEWVFARTDVACVVLYRWPGERSEMFPAMRGLTEIRETEVVLVKEFRSPGRTPDGLIHEVPGGSCESSDDSAKESATREVYEETGLAIAKNRLQYVGSRQALGVLSSHHVHCYSVELTEAEMAQAKRMAALKETHGEEQDTEMTYVEVTSVAELLRAEDTDWTTVGLVLRAVLTG